MGSIIEFFASVNKISLVAFVGVLGFLIYEVILLRKEQQKKQQPIIPHFDTQTVVNKETVRQQVTSVVQPIPVAKAFKSPSKPPVLVVVILIVMILFFLGYSIYFLMNKGSQPAPSEPTQPVVTEIKSPGLKIYDTAWMELKEADLLKSVPGTKVFIGLRTIDVPDIDRARIKINQTNWNITDITTLFNKEKKVYYKEYQVATGASRLKIDAQLHSSIDGWLGE
ncbi:hypothetical protein COY90_05550 [Candidatus Roizmanbacteria bacterium CG_4_10_14_0_8_um_filter_39_9]|uniref:Uncharacterized protein n=1 Tax=Candidatus Roizmanbacteria bacterium CG_4_10_14_0_8_um_filter_39_9 TaxID=1974829 RepID=A0A2M7QC46_9BACT|nr:MAG: hypothetical protein COY90_05550 [Candidatus Roizmanbacteria bacterium CG_4_10_14_0_8_um_filter_39_9]